MKLYKVLAQHIGRYLHFAAKDDLDRAMIIKEGLYALVKAHMPSGSGIDTGTKLALLSCGKEKMVFHCSFHHMDEHGGYTHWTEHTLYLKPSFIHDLTMGISGRNDNDIKDYLHVTYMAALDQEVEFGLFPEEIPGAKQAGKPD